MPHGSFENAATDGSFGERTWRLPARSRIASLCGVCALLVLSAVVPAQAQPSESVLPDGRGWEMVSPPNKGGATIVPLGQAESGLLGGVSESSEDGKTFTYAANAPTEPEPPGSGAPEALQVLASRGGSPTRWSSKDISTSHFRAQGVPAGEPQEYRFFSSNLESALLEPFGFPGHEFSRYQEPPLALSREEEEKGAKEERGLYLRHKAGCEPIVKAPTCFQPLVTAANDASKAAFGEQLTTIGATPDLKHVVFLSSVPLTAVRPKYPFGAYLYEWNEASPEHLQLVSGVPPRPIVAEGSSPSLGYEPENPRGQSARNAISADGSRVFFMAQEVHGPFALYMRDTSAEATINLSAPERGIGEPSRPRQEEVEEEVRFQAASSNGERVFFTDTLALTHESLFPRASLKGPSDLYACELPGPVSAASRCKLKDLTVARRAGRPVSAEVIGSIPGTSEDGSTVFFVANASLATGGPSPTGESPVAGNCERPNAIEAPAAGAQCNLYMERFENGAWQKPRLIAVLSQEDESDWGAHGLLLWRLTARVSPNGRYLAFMSDRELTHYNNHDEHPPEKPDEEVFLYDAQENHLVCVSCNPNAAKRPTGVFDAAEEESGQPKGLLVDPAGRLWNKEGLTEPHRGRWLAGSIPGWTPLAPEHNPYQSRYLLDNGRLFFNSADALVTSVPGQVTTRNEFGEGTLKTVGVENVYQYEPNGVGTCTRAGGCVSLISSGTSPQESGFLDASVSGNDVFFITANVLVPADVDTNFDAYDARVCAQEPTGCVQAAAATGQTCGSEAECKGSPGTPPGFAGGGTSTFSGPGNAGGRVETLNFVINKPKPPATKLAKALAACRKKYKHAGKKRSKCERQARQRYGTHTASKHAKHKGRHK